MLPEGYRKEDIKSETALSYIEGYEAAIHDIVGDILYNIQEYGDVKLVLDPDIALVNQDKAEIIANAVLLYANSNRDNIIISILDNQEDDQDA